MKITVELPEYLSIKQQSELVGVDPNTLEGLVTIISAVTKYTREDVLTWDRNAIPAITNHLNILLGEATPAFFPIITWNGVDYGFTPPSVMTIGEYVDLESLLKTPQENMVDIICQLYRPIATNNNGEMEGKDINGWEGKSDDDIEYVFKMYEVIPYDKTECLTRRKEMENMPIQLAQGALSFFLAVGLNSSLLSQTSSLTEEEKKQMVINTVELTKSLFHSTTDGFTQYTNSLKQTSSPQ